MSIDLGGGNVVECSAGQEACPTTCGLCDATIMLVCRAELYIAVPQRFQGSSGVSEAWMSIFGTSHWAFGWIHARYVGLEAPCEYF